MKILLLLLSNLYAFSPPGISQIKGQELLKNKGCDLHLSFGSYGSGTPFEVIKKIKAYLKVSKEIDKSYQWNWGLEGEFDYCLVLKDKKQMDKIYSDLKLFIPLESRHGYTTLVNREGITHKTTWPKK
jgi:hypothetical protein